MNQKYVNHANRQGLILMSKFKMGILPLAIEIGRYNNTPKDQRLCKFCTKNVIEDELHFMTECDLYKTDRRILLEKYKQQVWDYDFIKYLIEDKYYLLAKTVKTFINIRKNVDLQRILHV